MIVMPNSPAFEAKFREARVNKWESGRLSEELIERAVPLPPPFPGTHLLSRLPLDGAAYGSRLLARTLPGLGNTPHRLEQLPARVGGASLLPTRIEAPTILQLEHVVEAEEIWCAHCVIAAGHVLALVVKVGEGKAMRLREALHVVEGVF